MEDASLDDFGDGGTTSDDPPANGGAPHDDSTPDGDGTDPLEDAIDGDSATEDVGDQQATGGSASAVSPADGADDVDPARSTMTVTPGGAECDDCGERVRRRWTDDGALVCRDCKEW